jgi:hypothetical protein
VTWASPRVVITAFSTIRPLALAHRTTPRETAHVTDEDVTERGSKAAGLASYLAVLRDTLDGAQWDDYLARLPADTRRIVLEPPLPMTWIPDRHFQAALDAAAELVTLQKMFEIGREQMRRDMGTVYRVFIAMATMDRLLTRAAAIYGTYTRNGRMRSERVDRNTARVHIEDVNKTSPALWEYQRGNVFGVIEFARIKDPKVEIEAGGGHGPSVTYRLTWR